MFVIFTKISPLFKSTIYKYPVQRIQCKFCNLKWRSRRRCLSGRSGTFVWFHCTRWLSSLLQPAGRSSCTSRSQSLNDGRSRFLYCCLRLNTLCWTHWPPHCPWLSPSQRMTMVFGACNICYKCTLYNKTTGRWLIWRITSNVRSSWW